MIYIYNIYTYIIHNIDIDMYICIYIYLYMYSRYEWYMHSYNLIQPLNMRCLRRSAPSTMAVSRPFRNGASPLGCEVRIRANFLPGKLTFGLRAERTPTPGPGKLRPTRAEECGQLAVSIHSLFEGLEWPVAGSAPTKIVRDWDVEFASLRKFLPMCRDDGS
jgi:hypothetical protein